MNGRKQTSRKLLSVVAVVVGLVRCPAIARAQGNATPASAAQAVAVPSTVPRLIEFAGVVSPPVTGADQNESTSKTAQPTTLPIVFSLYEVQAGGSPLWTETQSVELDSQSRYTVLLGAESASGLPLDLFTSAKALWLGVQSAGGEQTRVLLVAVPYALKAADADTLGGKPASAYVTTEAAVDAPATTAAAAAAATGLQALRQTVPVASAGRQAADTGSASTSCSNITADGTATANFLAKFTAPCVVHQSAVFENSGNVGIGNSSPAGKLDVSGNTFIRGTLQLPATGTATGSTGYNSQPLDWLASAFNSSTKAAVNEHFRWQAEPVGNNTSSPSGKFNLLFASGGGTPAETGLSLSASGNLTGKQLISTVVTGTAPLVVSSTTQVSNLNASQLGGLGASAFAKVGSANSFNGNQSVTGNVSATNQLISTVATGTAPLSVNSATQVAKLNASLLGGLDSNAFAQIGTENLFVADQLIAGNFIATYVGDPGCGSGYAGIGFNGLSGCNNYSMIGNGTDTFLNRPSGGAMHFREGNTEQVTILSGGQVGIGTQTPLGRLEVDGLNLAAANFVGGTAQAGVFASGGTGADGLTGFAGSGTPPGYAGYFFGDVHVTGNLSKGGGGFKIDHPLHPASKYLYHSFVESPDMMNIYNGNVELDANGEAAVELPEWFGALNRDFRYQLTCIGGFAPVYIAQKVQNNSFRIAGGQPGLEVSWQVTGIRQDAWANAHRIPVEVDKSERERGYYIHPELYGAPEERGMEWARNPEMMRRMKARQARLAPQSTNQ
jgi:hypothetical protein